MKKYKYQNLSKEEKRKIQKNFFETDGGIILKKRFNRILIYSIILTILGIYFLIDSLINKGSVIAVVYACILILFGIAFIIARKYIKIIKLDEFLIKNKNTTKKK